MNIFVIGAATTKFGELWGTSPRTLAREAFENAIKDSGIKKLRIEALFVGNMLSGILPDAIWLSMSWKSNRRKPGVDRAGGSCYNPASLKVASRPHQGIL